MKFAPVFFTIGQVQHNPILNLGSYIPTIQERLRKAGYPGFAHGVQAQFDLTSALGERDSDQLVQPTIQKVDRYVFSNIATTNSFVLVTGALSFQTTSYDTFESLLEQLKLGLTILDESVGGLSFVERLGLRYLDVLAAAPGETLSKYIATELMGLPARIPESQFAYSFAETVLLAKDVGHVVSRTIRQNSPLGFPPDLQPMPLKLSERFQSISGEHAVIDTDGSFTERQPFNIARIEARLQALHDLIDKTFQASVTEYARKVWHGEGGAQNEYSQVQQDSA